jgi:hypothetical protein
MFLFVDSEVDKSHERIWDWELRELALILDDEYRFTIGKLLLKHGANGIHFEYMNTGDSRQDMRGKDLCFTLAETIESLCSSAQYIIAHNANHDCKILQWVYNGFSRGRKIPWPSGTSSICTMEHSTEVCRIRSPDFVGFKWPSLMESYCHLVDLKGFDGQHTALADTLACRRVFYALLDGGHIAHLNHLRRKAKHV